MDEITNAKTEFRLKLWTNLDPKVLFAAIARTNAKLFRFMKTSSLLGFSATDAVNIIRLFHNQALPSNSLIKRT